MADQHHLAGIPAQDAEHHIRLSGGLLPIHNRARLRTRRTGNVVWPRRGPLWLARVGDHKLLRGVHLQPKQRPRKTQKRLQLQSGVAQRKTVPVPQQEVAVLEHPQVAQPVVNGPQGLRLDRSVRQHQHHGPNLPFVGIVAVGRLAMDESRHAKGKQKPVLVQKVE